MKKIIGLLLCLILLIGSIPAMADSVTPEKTIGTWVLFKIDDNGNTYDSEALEELGFISLTIEFHADRTGMIKLVSPDSSDSNNLTWKIENNQIMISDGQYTEALSLSSGSLIYPSTDNPADKLYFKKTKDTTSKQVSTAYLSAGTFSLNSSKKTAKLTAAANKKAKSLKIPDTVKVNGITYKVTEIGANACSGMARLSTLTIGKNIKTIGTSAFAGCKKLKKITFTGTSLSKVKSKALSDIKASATITCPKKKVSRYQKLLKKGGLPKKARVKGK